MGEAMSAKSLESKQAAAPARQYQLNNVVMTQIWLERRNQRQLFQTGKIKFDCASPIVSKDRKLRALTEEIGEVARAIDLLENAEATSKILSAKEHLRDELTQVAAVAIAWLEALEEELKS